MGKRNKKIKLGEIKQVCKKSLIKVSLRIVS